VLEIGPSNGYSGIWIALGLSETGGRLITLEIDERRHSLAVRNFKAAGLEAIVEARRCDALEEIPKIDGPLDMVFIDAWKPDYVRYLDLALPKLRPGGVIIAHNVGSQGQALPEFVQALRASPQLETEFVPLTWSGFSVSRKKSETRK
jgi:predicted O-methyltransferase YrrM